jgi:hypothetical protein
LSRKRAAWYIARSKRAERTLIGGNAHFSLAHVVAIVALCEHTLGVDFGAKHISALGHVRHIKPLAINASAIDVCPAHGEALPRTLIASERLDSRRPLQAVFDAESLFSTYYLCSAILTYQ